MDYEGGGAFPGLHKFFPQLSGSGRDAVMELAWVDGRPEVMPHLGCSVAAPLLNPLFPATTTWSAPIVRTRSIDEEAAAMEVAPPAASKPDPGPPAAAPQAPLQPSSSGRVDHKRPRQKPLEGGASGAAGRLPSSSATPPGDPSSRLSRVEHVSYETTLLSDDDAFEYSLEFVDDDGDYDIILDPEDDSATRSGRSVRSKQVCSDERTLKDSKTAGSTTASMRERKRRNKFNQNIKVLQAMIPNTNKSDTVSVLDKAIDHLKRLQSLAQMRGITVGTAGTHQAVTPQECAARMMLAAQMAQMSGVGNGMGFNQQHRPSNMYTWLPFQYPPGFANWGSNVQMQ